MKGTFAVSVCLVVASASFGGCKGGDATNRTNVLPDASGDRSSSAGEAATEAVVTGLDSSTAARDSSAAARDSSADSSVAGRDSMSAKADASSDSSGKDEKTTTPSFPPTNLEPSEDCIHPLVEPDCADGFCRIPAGCFIMGAPRDEPFTCAYSCVQVQVTLTRDFLMGQTEVTREQWSSVGWEQPKQKRIGPAQGAECLEPECPVANVTFFDAVAFANRYSEMRELAPCYDLSSCTGEVGVTVHAS